MTYSVDFRSIINKGTI